MQGSDLEKAREEITSLRAKIPGENELTPKQWSELEVMYQKQIKKHEKELKAVEEERDTAYKDAADMDRTVERQTGEIKELEKKLEGFKATEKFIETLRETLIPHGAVQVTAQGPPSAVDVIQDARNGVLDALGSRFAAHLR